MATLPLEQWADAVGTVREGIERSMDGLVRLCDLCCLAGPSGTSVAYRRQVAASARAYMQALEGVSAMADGLSSVPEEFRDPMQMSRTLMGLVFSQSQAYFREMDSASDDAAKAFATEKAVALGMPPPTAAGASRSSLTSSSSAAPPVAGDTQPSEKKKKDPKEKKDKKDKKKKHGHDEGAEDADLTPIDAVGSNGDVLASGASAKEEGCDDPSHPATPTTPSGGDIERIPFIKVHNSLRDSLGVAVITARPDVFLPFEKIVTEASLRADRCELRYYLSCPSLPKLLRTVLNGSSSDEAFAERQQEATLDLLCDALVCEDINVLPLSNAIGEVSLEEDQPLPSCAWRSAEGEGNDGTTATMDTFVAFMEHGAIGLGQCLAFHDALVRSEDEKEQIVHVIRPIPSSPGILEVSVHHPSASLLRGAANAGALASLYRRFFTAFFPEVAYSPQVASSSSMGDTLAMRKANADASAVAAQHAQMEEAKAAAKASRGKGGLIGLTKAIASAPLTAVSALNDVSQAASFRRNFPELQDEEVITSYNCAWLDGSKVIKQGYLYATKGHFCFQGTVLSAQFVLDYSSIEGMKKCKNGMFDNSIEIEDEEGTRYFLTSFMGRDEAYKALFKAWTSSRR